MAFKFENLEVWQQALEYIDLVYDLANKLPKNEEFNLKSQITRAATSIALNIAEGSTGQSDAEQNRFLGMAIRSLIETVACLRIIQRRKYLTDGSILDKADNQAQLLVKKLHTFRKALTSTGKAVREEQAPYDSDES